MSRSLLKLTLQIFILSILQINGVSAQSHNMFNPKENTIITDFHFNGYTKYWHDNFNDNIRYGNLFRLSVPDADYTIAQSKLDIADDMNIPGLSLEEGFMNTLLKTDYIVLDMPSFQDLAGSALNNNVLVLTDPQSETGKKLLSKLPVEDAWKQKLKSHQYNAKDYKEVKVFRLESGEKKIFVISSENKVSRDKVLKVINNTQSLLKRYDLHRGWFGAETLLKSVTCTAGHPLEVIGKGMNEGNTWFTFSGYMDFLAQEELVDWLAKVNLPVLAEVGYGNIFGCHDYGELQVQNMFTDESWINFAHEKNGYAFRSVYNPVLDKLHYDGYLATEGNKEQIDNENVPFITTTGDLDGDAIPCMVLFVNKGEQISHDQLWESIMKRREVAILDNGKMMGPELYRNVLQLLLLDRVFLEEYFGDRINIEAVTEGYQLNITLTNTYKHASSGTLRIVLPPELKLEESLSLKADLPANSTRKLSFKIRPSASAMGKTNPIAIHYNWETSKKSTLAMIELPPAISVHQLLYGHSPSVNFPVSIHNFTDQEDFPVNIEVSDKINPAKIVFKASEIVKIATGKFKDFSFDLGVPAGNYTVRVSALGMEALSQLGVGRAKGSPKLTSTDLNGDGVDEYIMENDSVKLTLLTTGGRVIEYIIKSRNDNVTFKMWPEKPVDDRRMFRKRGYYPYGGFEDFLGQASMETHKVYDAEILRKEGDYVQVRMTADYFGNKLEKTYTLYGNSPLLEVRFALTFINPEANMIAPVPVLELGKNHGPEDVFITPEKDGLKEYRMQPERYFGRIIYLKEGWDAGYDTRENISFVAAFPVRPPLFLHMFMNHPRNPDAHFYCHEFQPWVPIFRKSTMYFTYYFWGTGDHWQNGVKALRERNLITEQ